MAGVLEMDLREELQTIPLIDTHEHLVLEEDRLSTPIDFFYLIPHYACSDLINAGMPPSLFEELCGLSDHQLSVQEKWTKFAPYWRLAKNTTYCKVLEIIAQDIFGIAEINQDTFETLDGKIRSSNQKGWVEYIVKEKANIECCIVEYLGRDFIYGPAKRPELMSFYPDRRVEAAIPAFESSLMKRVENLDGIIVIRNLEKIRAAERKYEINIFSLDDILRILDIIFEKAITEGVVAIKTALAYNRIIFYQRTAKHEAEILFNRIFTGLGEGISWQEAKPLQDYLMHEVIRRAIEAGLPVQIHTGLQEGNANIISNSDPTHLINLFLEYPQAKFDIFHTSYPYTPVLTALAKNFPNVYPDLCWMYVVSPYAARRTLCEWIETLPANKILGFGGDYLFVEGSYAHAKLARDNLARVLAEKIEEGYFSRTDALDFAHRILRENARELFKLGDN